MPCNQHSHLLSAYIDGELPDSEHEALTQHIIGCSDCAALAEELRETSSMVSGLGREPLPVGLSHRLRRTLAQTQDRSGTIGIQERVAPGKLSPSAGAYRPWIRAGLLKHAAVFFIACLLSSLATWSVLTGSTKDNLLAQDLLSAHLRSLLQDSPIQVASSDAHTVKPWFAGKVDFSPEVRDLVAQGYPLLGGRLDTIAGRRVGALVYKRRLHIINVFAWTAGDGSEVSPALSTRNGYNILKWTRGGVTYAAVSDVESSELQRLPDLL